MALIKFCDYCKKTYPYEDKDCSNKCREKRAKVRSKEYDDIFRRNKEIYDSKLWKSIRAKIRRLDGMCLWSYYMDKKIVPGKIAHHIVELEEDISKAFSLDNLIYVSDSAHRVIHSLYEEDKEKTQNLLRELISRHRGVK